VGNDGHILFVTSDAMMLILVIAIWVILVLFFVVLARGAATADGRGVASPEGYPTAYASEELAQGALLVLEEGQERPAPAAVRARARGDRGRAGQYAA
jgi:hypothetical protein